MAGFKPYTFDVLDELGLEIPRNKRREALEAAAELLKVEMLDYIGSGKSPVSGGKWVRSLTPAYAEQKAEDSSADFANLERTGDLLDSLTVEPKGQALVIDVGEDQYGKAEGHITGVYGEHSKRERPRQFMPQGEETFKRDIMRKLKEVLAEFEDG